MNLNQIAEDYVESNKSIINGIDIGRSNVIYSKYFFPRTI